jgi:hypothetical protein
MPEISRRFEQFVISSYRKLQESDQILPVKTDRGILVGRVLIESNGYLKNLWIDNDLIYKDISLNDVAVTLANWLAKNLPRHHCDTLYQCDQEYGKWYTDCLALRVYREKLIKNRDFDRADVVQARYQQSKSRAEQAKRTALSLIQNNK